MRSARDAVKRKCLALKIAELRAQLQSRYLETTGLKIVLVARLTDAILKEEQPTDLIAAQVKAGEEGSSKGICANVESVEMEDNAVPVEEDMWSTGWSCRRCTYVNGAHAQQCQMCFCEKEPPSPTVAKRAFRQPKVDHFFSKQHPDCTVDAGGSDSTATAEIAAAASVGNLRDTTTRSILTESVIPFKFVDKCLDADVRLIANNNSDRLAAIQDEKAGARYRKYKAATSCLEVIDLGGTRADLSWCLQLGVMSLLEPSNGLGTEESNRPS
jgi:hypothetical protein